MTREALGKSALARRLLPGEKVLWWGQPRQGVFLTARDGFLIPFSLLWGGFAIFWEASVLRSNAPGFFALWGVPFVLAGLFMIAGRFFVDAWLRARSYYGVTDRRVLIARIGQWPSFQAVSLDRLPAATLTEGPEGRGTITFGQGQPLWSSSGRGMGFSVFVPIIASTPQFFAIAEADKVFAMIQQLSDAAPRRPPD